MSYRQSKGAQVKKPELFLVVCYVKGSKKHIHFLVERYKTKLGQKCVEIQFDPFSKTQKTLEIQKSSE